MAGPRGGTPVLSSSAILVAPQRRDIPVALGCLSSWSEFYIDVTFSMLVALRGAFRSGKATE